MVQRRFVCNGEEEAFHFRLVWSNETNIDRRHMMSDELRFFAAKDFAQLIWRNLCAARKDNCRISAEQRNHVGKIHLLARSVSVSIHDSLDHRSILGSTLLKTRIHARFPPVTANKAIG